MASMSSSPVSKFSLEGRDKQSIIAELEGTLLRSTSLFPYFMLVALEAGSPIRALLLLVIFPFVQILEIVGFTGPALWIITLFATAGVHVNSIKAVAKAVLPRFYLENLRPTGFRAFRKFGGKKYVVTSIPRFMVEPFLREYMDVDCVIGSEIITIGNYSTGIISGETPAKVLHKIAKDNVYSIDVGLHDGRLDQELMLLCQESYVISNEEKSRPLPRKEYPKSLIFHDGRLVASPTPFDCLVILLWLPLGGILAISRIMVGNLLPYKVGLTFAAATGMKIRVKFHTGEHPQVSHSCDNHRSCGTLYVCSHRTLIDPVLVASTLQRHITAVTYSISRVSEILSPIRTVRLSRDRSKDGEMMKELLRKGDLVVCPEGTTCREPYLLRFSPLFAEIAENIVPVAVSANGSMFYGTTVRGYKWLDSFFFLMNPNPNYHLEYLEKLYRVHLCEKEREKSCYDVANHVQRKIAHTLGFECTNLTRRDKYRMLAGNDGMK